MSLWSILAWPLAAVGVATLALGALLAQPVKSPPPLESIHAGATAISQDGKPELSRFQARDGTWLAYRLYPAAHGETDRLAILAHGSSASSEAMNAVALALAQAGCRRGRGRCARPRRFRLARRHRLRRSARGRSRRSRGAAARGVSESAADARRPFGRRRFRFARRRRAGRRELRPLRAARALSRLSRADQSPCGRVGILGGARHSAPHRDNHPRTLGDRLAAVAARHRLRQSPRGGQIRHFALFLPAARKLRPAARLEGAPCKPRRAGSH